MNRIAIALVVLLALVGGACESGDGGGGEGATRIVVQAAGGESELKAIDEMANAFEAANPGVTVDLVGVAEQGDHMARLSTAFAGGRPPDVFLLNYRRFGQFAAKGVIEPPPPGAVNRADYFEPPIEAFTFNGELLCLPQNASSTVTYFNPALFEKAGVPLPKRGWTVADMRAAAEKLQAAGIEGIGFEHSFRTVAPFVWGAGDSPVDNTQDPTFIALDTERGRLALSYLKGLLDFGVTPAEEAADPAEERFARGELGMFLDSRRAVPKLRRSEGLRFDVAPLPEGFTSATLLASDAYCVSKAGKHRDIAHRFARYAVGPDGGRVLAEAGRTVPSHKALANSPAFLAPDKQPPSSQVWLDVIPTARRLPNVAAWHETEEAASGVIEQYFAGRLSLDDAVRRIKDESRRLLDR